MGIDTYLGTRGLHARRLPHLQIGRFEAQSQVMIDCEKRGIVATLNVVHDQNAIEGLT